MQPTVGQVKPMSQRVVIGHRHVSPEDPGIKVLLDAGLEVTAHAHFQAPEAQADLEHCDGMIVSLQPIDGPQLDRMPNCKVITRLGVGYDNIDVPAATAHGVRITYVPDYGVHEVSTHAITLLLVMARNMESLLKASAEGRWDHGAMGTVQRIQDQTLGVLGLGRIGRQTALKGLGLGMRVLGYDPVIPDEDIRATGIEPADMDRVLVESDYISLHVPSMPETRHIINAAALAAMKPTARIINTARGPLIDEEALLAAVRDGTIAGAALDVFETEPPPEDHPLLHEPNVIVTPHAAWYSEAAKTDMQVKASQDVVNVLSGNEPVYPLN